jgi:hypothetical protein
MNCTKGYIYTRRWGEQTVLPLALSLSLDPDQIFFTGGVALHHYAKPWKPSPQCHRASWSPNCCHKDIVIPEFGPDKLRPTEASNTEPFIQNKASKRVRALSHFHPFMLFHSPYLALDKVITAGRGGLPDRSASTRWKHI